MRGTVRWFVIGSLLVVGAGCGASRMAGWERQLQRSEGNLAEFMAEAEKAWKQRDTREGLVRAIELYERAAAVDPSQRDVAIRLARAYYFLADGYHRGDKAAQIKYYDLAAQWGERAMATNPRFREAVEQGTPVEEAIELLDKGYVGAVYWSASAIGKWARLEGFTTILKYKNKIKKFMEWCTAQDETFFYGGPHRYWGAYYAVAPSFAGGDLDKSKYHYEKSLEIAPHYLGTKVLMADTYATKIQDRALYKRLLEEVLAGDPTVYPEIVPEQKVEQQKAKELLALLDERFALRAGPSLWAGLGR